LRKFWRYIRGPVFARSRFLPSTKRLSRSTRDFRKFLAGCSWALALTVSWIRQNAELEQRHRRENRRLTAAIGVTLPGER
jgi:hypothetical protein